MSIGNINPADAVNIPLISDIRFPKARNSMLPKGILFDLDDTIIAFDAVANPTWQRVCETYAHKSTLFDPTSLFKAIQEVRGWYWSDNTRHRSGRLNLDKARR
jgi:putative hydrolase of the HAD superfamily